VLLLENAAAKARTRAGSGSERPAPAECQRAAGAASTSDAGSKPSVREPQFKTPLESSPQGELEILGENVVSVGAGEP